MSECVDVEARELIRQTQTYLQELASALWGDDKTRSNGLRSKVAAHDDKLGELEIAQRNLVERLRHYIDTEREETCHGLAALAAYEQEGTEVAVAKIQAGGQKASAAWQAWAMIGVQLLTILAVVLKA